MSKAEETFWRHTEADPNTGCWLWRGSVRRHGYGVFNAGCRTYIAHRFSYELHIGAIPPGLYVCHKCDNPRCVNPEHLWVGTAADNNADMTRKGRRAIGTRNNSKLSDDDVRAILSSDVPAPRIAREYGVERSLIHQIRARKRWKHITT